MIAPTASATPVTIGRSIVAENTFTGLYGAGKRLARLVAPDGRKTGGIWLGCRLLATRACPLTGLDSLEEYKSFTLSERADRLETVGGKRVACAAGLSERGPFRVFSEEACHPGASPETDVHDAAARPEHARDFADGGGAVGRGERADQPGRIIDNRNVEGVILGRERCRQCDLDFDQYTRVSGPFACASCRFVVRHDCDRAAGQADFGRYRAQAAAVFASHLNQTVAHLHAGHANDQHVRIAGFGEWIQHVNSLLCD
jgi:hypothetical protein